MRRWEPQKIILAVSLEGDAFAGDLAVIADAGEVHIGVVGHHGLGHGMVGVAFGDGSQLSDFLF